MFDQQVGWTGIRFGVLAGLTCFALIVLIYLVGVNPYGEYRLLTLIFIPVFVFFGISYFKKFTDQQLGFVRAFRIGLSVTFYAALVSAMLLYAFGYVAGPEVMQEYIGEVRGMMEATKAETIKIIGEKNYLDAYEMAGKTTPFDLASDEFMKKLFVGIIASLIGAIFFRK